MAENALKTSAGHNSSKPIRKLPGKLQGQLRRPNGFITCLIIAVLLAFLSASLASSSYRIRTLLVTSLTMIDALHTDNTGVKSENLTGKSHPIMTFDDHHDIHIQCIFQTFSVLFSASPANQAVQALPQADAPFLLIDQKLIQDEVRAFFLSRFALYFIIYVAAGLLVVRLMRRYLVKPLDNLVAVLNDFSADPTTAMPVPVSLKTRPEFVEAALALESLQRNTLLALRQRERLADIGEAVAKVNHDIRNALSSATLVADTLLASQDPKIRQTAPFVVRSLEQAVDLCQSMLDFLVETPDPKPTIVNVREMAADLATNLGVKVSLIGPDHIYIDKAMLNRILLNLIRNATLAGAKEIVIDIWKAGHLCVIDISDDGPGIPEESWNDLFLAFRTSRRGGTGLGLAISRDIAVALGGNLKLARSNDNGSEFRLQLAEEVYTKPSPKISHAAQ